MKSHLIIASLVVLVLFVISESVLKWDKVEGDSKIAQINDPIMCAQYGGTIESVCMNGIEMCIVKFKDAGKSCSDSSECDGACLSVRNDVQLGDAVLGACSQSSDPCGLFLPLKNGKVAARVWAD
jgi:hypothetical protein